MSNEAVAAALTAHARTLAAAGDNLYRVRAFRRAAGAVLALPTPVSLATAADLARLPGVGDRLAETIRTLAAGDAGSGRVSLPA